MRMLTPWFPYSSEYEWLELDGNSQTVSQSEQPRYNVQGPCSHFLPRDQGDAFFDISKATSLQRRSTTLDLPQEHEEPTELAQAVHARLVLGRPLAWLRSFWQHLWRR